MPFKGIKISSAVIFIVSDLIVAESGLMSVVIAGGVIGYSDTPQIDAIKNYSQFQHH